MVSGRLTELGGVRQTCCCDIAKVVCHRRMVDEGVCNHDGRKKMKESMLGDRDCKTHSEYYADSDCKVPRHNGLAS